MADPISIVVRPIIEKCIDEAVNFSKEKYASIAGVNNECQNLGDKLTAIKAVLKDAEDRHEQLADEAVNNWLAKLIDAACDAEDIVDDFRTEAGLWEMRRKLQQVCFCLGRIKNKLEAADDMKDILKRLENISKDYRSYKFDGPPVAQDGDGGGDSSSLPDHIVGRKEDKAKIIEMLLAVTKPEIEGTAAGHLSVIPIIGMGGIGKSTLCRFVIEDDSVKTHFDGLIIWVRVKEEFELETILKEIEIECQSKGKSQTDVNLLSLNQLVIGIQKFLAGRRFLLVLDDVWTENYQNWESLKRVFNGGGEGSKVLITSRSSRVAQIMGTQEPYVVNCLGDEECRSLFQYVAYKDQTSLAPDLENLEREIVKMCGGLPLAVKAMGGMIRGKDIKKEWKKICNKDIWERKATCL